MKIPDWMPFEDASTFPVGVITCGQAMYQHMKLPSPASPTTEKQKVLVYGGSSATGMFAIQYAKLSGLDVIATCSPRNFELVKSLGASAAYDYKSPTCGQDIRRDTDNQLFYAFDCISEGSAPAICAEALSSESKSPDGNPPTYGTILRVQQPPRSDVKMCYILAYTSTGEYFRFKGPAGKPPVEWPANAGDFEFAKEWFSLTEKLIAEKKLKPLRANVRKSLENVTNGMEDMKNGKNSGEKLVYTIG